MMGFSDKVLREDEKAIYNLRELYSKHGYSHYRVSKFEEYDLYARNKSFLVSENLLTFTDTNGKLMALKPDVTLSIIKNAVADDKTSYKLYYDENVYRTTTGGDGFREIRQTGLESIGNVDLYSECEVLMLAMKSLEVVSEEYLLDISHMGLLDGLLENIGVCADSMSEFFALIKSKNAPALKALCISAGISDADTQSLLALTSMYSPIKDTLFAISDMVRGERMERAYKELCDICTVMDSYGYTDKLYVDFSVVNDMNYYDGVIFKGFVKSIPDSILSGGRYDRLMARFGKKTEAIGFAVYLDKLERLGDDEQKYDIDVMLVYDDKVAPERIIEAVRSFYEEGKTVRTVSSPDNSVRCRQILRITEGGLEILETND